MNLFQSPEWEQFKLASGYQKSYRVDGVLLLQKNLPLGRSMLYSPMVDLSQKSKASQREIPLRGIKSQKFISKVKTIGKKEKAIFYRLELDIPTQNSIFDIQHSAFIKSFEEMQPEHTLILDISKTEDEILAQMKPKGRYNIKVAQKNNVRIVEESDAKNFFILYSTMSQRHKISHRNAGYFQKLIDILGTKGYCKVFTAMHNDTPIASVIISFYNNRGTYLFGGSSDQYRNLMAPYLLQWRAIQEAKKLGCSEYDFFGIAPAGAANHPWQGVTDFKKKFGGQEVALAGSWDLILRPFEYQIFKMVEKIRRR